MKPTIPTPGLDHIPPAERFAIYRATHRRLIREEESYRKRYNHYVISYSLIIAVVFFGMFWFGSSALGITGSALLSLAATATIVYIAFRQQRHMNQCIGRALQSQPR